MDEAARSGDTPDIKVDLPTYLDAHLKAVDTMTTSVADSQVRIEGRLDKIDERVDKIPGLVVGVVSAGVAILALLITLLIVFMPAPEAPDIRVLPMGTIQVVTPSGAEPTTPVVDDSTNVDTISSGN